MHNRLSNPICILEGAESTDELYPTLLKPSEMLSRSVVRNFNLVTISSWFCQQPTGASQEHGQNLFF